MSHPRAYPPPLAGEVAERSEVGGGKWQAAPNAFPHSEQTPLGMISPPMRKTNTAIGHDHNNGNGFQPGEGIFGLGGVLVDHTVVEAECKYFSRPKGLGFVVPLGTTQDVFVHMDLLRQHAMRELKPGRRVWLEVGSGPQGLTATSIPRPGH